PGRRHEPPRRRHEPPRCGASGPAVGWKGEPAPTRRKGTALVKRNGPQPVAGGRSSGGAGWVIPDSEGQCGGCARYVPLGSARLRTGLLPPHSVLLI